ncbi:MAG: ATP synthase F0 subunit B [Candidatus Melainabacteria bacterium]|jgi:F0F1-type ATP synthase membrane subunit b/b'|nr:ATP synthase F0 subunit B [Candidatus Melainabacteria bacterium]
MYLFAAQVETHSPDVHETHAGEAEATHAEGHESHHAMGPFDNNFINWLLLLVFLGWLIQKNMPGVFKSRRESIECEIRAAALARQEGEAFLEEQRKKLANVEAETKQLIADAKTAAQQSAALIEEQTSKEMGEMLLKFESSIANEKQLLITEMRQAVVKAAVAISQEQLRGQVNDKVKGELLNKFMSQLDTIAQTGDSSGMGKIESTAQSRNK